MRRLLLDTNVLLWLLFGDRARVSVTAVEALEDEDSTLLISAASVWEIAIKRSLGRLRIADAWPTAIGRLDAEPLPVTALHAAGVEQLPLLHRDPFDRLLVAQAIEERAELVTADARLREYPVAHLW